MSDSEPKDFKPSDPLSALASVLPLWSSLLVLPLIEWQRALLNTYEKAFKDSPWPGLTREQAGESLKLLQAAYTELSGTTDEMRKRFGQSGEDVGKRLLECYTDLLQGSGKRLADWHSDLLHGCRQTLEGVLRSAEQKVQK